MTPRGQRGTHLVTCGASWAWMRSGPAVGPHTPDHRDWAFHTKSPWMLVLLPVDAITVWVSVLPIPTLNSIISSVFCNWRSMCGAFSLRCGEHRCATADKRTRLEVKPNGMFYQLLLIFTVALSGMCRCRVTFFSCPSGFRAV